jgi:L-lactate dehydrogenase complex protein LldE
LTAIVTIGPDQLQLLQVREEIRITKFPDVQLFVTCIVNQIFPQVGWAVVKVLERSGVKVRVPLRQTCCGQPALNAGFWEEAREMARHTLDVLHETEGPVIIPSGSCADMLVHHYPRLLAADSVYGPQASTLSERVYEFSQYVVDVLGKGSVGARFQGRVAYHPSCHLLRGLGVDSQSRRLIENIAEVEVIEITDAEECCGFGGLFSVKMGNISGAMLDRKLEHVLDSKAEVLAGCDMSCLMHLEGGLRRRGQSLRVMHLAELLSGSEQ